MTTPQIYVAVALVVLVMIAVLVFVASPKRQGSRLTPLAGLAFGFILAGLFFGQNRTIGYGLLAVGVILAVMDMFRRSRAG